MDIAKLKNKRQLNVQEQNAIKKDRILQQASYWRSKGIPIGLAEVFSAKGINVASCILFDYQQDFPGCNTDQGMVVTHDGRFFEFEMDLDKPREKLLELCVWREVTDSIEINAHKPGTGATDGYLALDVLRELNNRSLSELECCANQCAKRLTQFPDAKRQAHKHSANHRNEIEHSELCGCFYCCSIFSPQAIVEWIDEDENDIGQCALCPRCGIDSVIGSQSGFPITKAFLNEMKKYWF